MERHTAPSVISEPEGLRAEEHICIQRVREGKVEAILPSSGSGGSIHTNNAGIEHQTYPWP